MKKITALIFALVLTIGAWAGENAAPAPFKEKSVLLGVLLGAGGLISPFVPLAAGAGNFYAEDPIPGAFLAAVGTGCSVIFWSGVWTVLPGFAMLIPMPFTAIPTILIGGAIASIGFIGGAVIGVISAIWGGISTALYNDKHRPKNPALKA